MPDLEEPGDDDGCEHVKRPGGPVATEPEPDEPVDEPDSGSEKLY